MSRHRFSLHILGPTILVSLLLFGLCIGMFVFLSLEYTGTAEVLGEDVDSRRVAQDLEISVNNLIARLQKGTEQVNPLHVNIKELRNEAWLHADKEREIELYSQLSEALDGYFEQWNSSFPDDSQERKKHLAESIRLLKENVLPICRELRYFNAREIERSEAAHRRTVKRMARGLATVCVTGAAAGILLGFGVARRLRRSIYQLSVQIRAAAGRLGQDLPTVTLTRDGDLARLQEQMQQLVADIEQVVGQLHQRDLEVLRAEQLSSVGQLAAGAAHELRNPLTAIKMLVQAKREEDDQRGLPTEDLQIVENEVRRMERCLQTFLDFARPPKLERRRVDLGHLLKQPLELLAVRARKQQVFISFTPPEQPVMVEADPEQLQQLLLNLLLNALDVLPRGGRVAVQLLPPCQGSVELRVLDDGPGIASQVLPRLFHPFLSSKETGLGLGLVVSRRIAEAHGGTLDGGNREQGGACFVLSLPALEDKSPGGVPESSQTRAPFSGASYW